MVQLKYVSTSNKKQNKEGIIMIGINAIEDDV